MFMKFIKTFEDYLSVDQMLSRCDLSNLKLTGKENSFSNRLLKVWLSNVKESKTLDELKKEITKILNDPKLIASKYTISYWKYQIAHREQSKIKLLDSMKNVILKAEGLGVICKDKNRRL